jgi:hypothetical protein
MARFVQAQFPTQHAGVERFERAAETVKETARQFDSARGTATLLLAAIVSALLVVANELVETWTEGHLMAAWVATWAVGFAALALFAAPARRAGAALREVLKAWGASRKQAAEDRKLWDLALSDARVMADLSRAMSRDAVRDVRGYY